MYIQQLYTGCLSEAAYYIESQGEAAIVDPLRDTEPYLALARERGASIRYIFETHFHADFVSGHIDLAKATGAPIVYGPGADTAYQIYNAKDGEVFTLGQITIEVIHTPGHTLESVCYLVKDEQGQPHSIFTGDTLFVGDVGRPDLSSGNLEKEELAAILYQTIQQKIKKLPDHVIVYPAHGAGSSCGKNMGPETHSTIGEQKLSNYALQEMSQEEFVKAVTDGLATPPQYFPINARINKEGYNSLEQVRSAGLQSLDPEAFEKRMKDEDVWVLDTRPASEFTQGFIPGSVSIGLEGRFAEWAGILLPFNKPLLLVTEPGKEEESLIRLARVGFDQMEGFLKGGFPAWQESGRKIDLIINVEPDELAMDIPFDPNLVVVDVRRPTEFGDGHVRNAVNLPLDDLSDPGAMANIDDHQNLYLHCQGGYRSVIAASFLKKQGIHNLRNILGGWNMIKEEKRIETAKEQSVLN